MVSDLFCLYEAMLKAEPDMPLPAFSQRTNVIYTTTMGKRQAMYFSGTQLTDDSSTVSVYYSVKSNRRILSLILSITLLVIPLLAGAVCPEEDNSHRYIMVPFDHAAPEKGSFPLYFELAAPYDPQKETLFVLSDGQQFFIRPHSMVRVMQKFADSSFNTVGIITRGKECSPINGMVNALGTVDYKKAYTVYSSRQYVEDIELVRQALVGKNGKIMLYGGSGGGLLVYQYLAQYGQFVKRTFTQCAVMPHLEKKLNIEVDHFHTDIAQYDPELPSLLQDIMTAHPSRRKKIMHIFQRMNFFLPHREIQKKRADFIREMGRGNLGIIDRLFEKYQCNAVESLMASPEGAAIKVRIFEIFYPLIPTMLSKLSDETAFFPEYETMMSYIKPFWDLVNRNEIEGPSDLDESRLKSFSGEVFILAGRFDHTVSWQSQNELSRYFEKKFLFMANDNHMFMADPAGYKKMRLLFYKHGLRSPILEKSILECSQNRWSENKTDG